MDSDQHTTQQIGQDVEIKVGKPKSRLVLFDPVKVVLYYTVIGLIWISISDSLTVFNYQDSPDALLRLSMLKGFCFVLVTALCLYLFLRRHLAAYHRQEQALRESQEHYRLLVENAPGAIFIHDDAYRFVYANVAALRLFGVETLERLVGQPVLDFVAEDSMPSVRRRMRRVLEDFRPVELCTQQYVRSNGTTMDVEGAAVPFPVAGRPGALVFLRDISAQKAAESSLRESEAKYRLLADNAHDLIFTLDFDFEPTYISPSVQKMRGIPVERAMQQSLKEIMTPESYAKVQAVVAAHPDAAEEAGYVERIDLELYRHDGSTVWVETVVRPMLDASGRSLGFVGVSRDITERRKAEEERNRSWEFLARILSTIPDPVFVKDSGHRFVLVNEALCQMLGHTSEEIQGKMDVDFVSQEEAEAFLDRDRLVLETGQEDIAEERFTDLQGQPRVLVTKKGLFVDAAGHRFVVGVIRDVTEDKNRESRLRDSLLEKEVLLKEVHHRVKNNLQIISSLLFLQQEGIEDPAIQELFDESRSRIASMALVHEELYRSGDLGRVDVKEYLERLAPRVIQTLRGGKRLEIVLELAVCHLPVDKAIPFGLIINELLTNAIKHGFEGREAGEIRLVVAVQDAFVRAEVADDGVALPGGFHPESCKTLGMQLVVQLTRQLRGALTFGSGQGTVFRLSFPLGDVPESTQIIH